jgi:RimJ/RimL family protein N-acetyltransferase
MQVMRENNLNAGRRGREQEALTPEVVLRDVIDADLPALFEHQQDPEATRMAAFPSRDRETFMAHWAKIMADRTNILQTIVFDGQVAGNIVSWNQDGRREVGYWLGREFWGRGIATFALRSFLERMKMRPLYAHVAKRNIASRRVLEKCGFTLIGADRVLAEAPAEPVEEFIFKLG